jgi:outer membrane receptor protein involved in Fe transport
VVSLVTRQVAPGTTLDGRVDRINSSYINTADVEVSGIDARFRYRYDTDRWGSFRTDLSYSLNLTDKFRQFTDDELIDFRDDLANLNQRSRARGSISWDKGDWSTTVFGTRYGSNGSFARTDGCAANQPDRCWSRRLPPYMLYNLTVGKRFGEDVLAQFQVVNVFDNQYREDNSQTGYPFFNSFIGADPLGRRFNFSVQYRF